MIRNRQTIVYIDGACWGNGQVSAIAGIRSGGARIKLGWSHNLSDSDCPFLLAPLPLSCPLCWSLGPLGDHW